jgi:hypothetical protein
MFLDFTAMTDKTAVWRMSWIKNDVTPLWQHFQVLSYVLHISYELLATLHHGLRIVFLKFLISSTCTNVVWINGSNHYIRKLSLVPAGFYLNSD